MLQLLKNRLDRKNLKPKRICIDNRCQWRHSLQNIFGYEVEINLDHATQRGYQRGSKRIKEVPQRLRDDFYSEAFKQSSSWKAPGQDAAPAEVYKTGGPTLLNHLTSLYQSMWEKEQLPQEFRDATIVHIYKRKGNRQSCDNHRGISLLSITGKILARVLLNRLLLHLEKDFLPESQCGFRAGRGTVDMIFAAHQLKEKYIEHHQDLYTTFVDPTKAFDTVSRDGLWKIMAKFGCPKKFIAFVRQFPRWHDGPMSSEDGDSSGAFPVTNGVKQGYVLAPTLIIA